MRVKADPSRSVVAKQWDAHRRLFLRKQHDGVWMTPLLDKTADLSPCYFRCNLCVYDLVCPFAGLGEWPAWARAFFGSAIVIGNLLPALAKKKLTSSFVEWRLVNLWVLRCGRTGPRGLVVMMEAGHDLLTPFYTAPKTLLAGWPEHCVFIKR